MIYEFFDKKSAGIAFTNNEVKQNLQLVEKLYKPTVTNLEKKTVYSKFKDNIWGADLAHMKLISKLNKDQIFIVFYWYF